LTQERKRTEKRRRADAATFDALWKHAVRSMRESKLPDRRSSGPKRARAKSPAAK
jgi:hypothetical protein